MLIVFFGALWLLVAAFPGLTLFSGQVIKQFESYSLAESFARIGWSPYESSIPCDGGIRWVLELPLFAGIGGVFIHGLPEHPFVLPLGVYGLFLAGLFRLRKAFDPTGPIWGWAAVASAPVFLRFSSQFLPDPLAVAFLLHGAVFFLGRRKGIAGFFFLLAVSVKPTVLPSVFFFMIAFSDWILDPALDVKQKTIRLARAAVYCACFALPFVAWALSLRAFGIPSPMHEGGLLSIGEDWGILLDRKFYSKFFVWTVFKGVGPILAGFAVFAFFGWKDRPEKIRRLAIWAFGIVPYWLVVRRLNFIHDYYSLSFFLPIALLGALAADEARRRLSPKWRILVPALLVASILQGVGLFVRSGLENPRRPVGTRPIFCGTEFRSETLMHLPPPASSPQ
jgi:hypothetical protein